MMPFKIRIWKTTYIKIIVTFILMILTFGILILTKYYCGIMILNKSCFSKTVHVPSEFKSNTKNHNKIVTNEFEKGYKEIVRNNSNCPSEVIFARSGKHRLGNHMIEYISAWATAKQSNFMPVVSDAIFTSLNSVFDSLSVIPASTFLTYLDKPCEKKFKRIFFKGPAIKGIEDLDEPLSKRKPIALRPAIILVDKIIPLRHEMRKEFRFREKYWTYAQETLHLYRQNLNYPNETASESTYVGIHARRTDYKKYLRVNYGLKNEEVAGTKYFLRASSFMLKRLHEVGKSKVVLVVLSDDMKWATNELIPELQLYIGSKNMSKSVIAVWGGSRDYKRDFALLSSCNHSILSYGTFGISSALLAGGWTLVYNIKFGGRTKITGAMHFARDISGWGTLQ